MSGGFSYGLMQRSQRAKESHEGSRRGLWWSRRWCGEGQPAEHLVGIWDDERESQETQWPTSSCFSAFNVLLGHQRNGDTWLPSPNGSHMRSEGRWGWTVRGCGVGGAPSTSSPLPLCDLFHLHFILLLKFSFLLLLTWICSSRMN